MLTEQIFPADMNNAERAYISLFGGECWEATGYAPDGHVDTAFGNSEIDALQRAAKAGLK